MPSRNCDLQSTPGLVLPPDILKIHIVYIALLQQMIGIHLLKLIYNIVVNRLECALSNR